MCCSINCQAICDAHGNFIDAEIKWPGSLHDDPVFANCAVQKSYSAGKCKLFHKVLLDGQGFVPQLILGYLAYPLLPYVLQLKRAGSA